MMKSSTLRCSFGSIQSSGLKVPSEPSPRGTKQATWQEISETSNSSTRRAPLLPASSRDQPASTPLASGVTSPSPVITTRRMSLSARFCCWACRTARPDVSAQPASETNPLLGAGLLGEELHGIADGLNLLGGIVRNLASELFLESHDQLDGVEAVGAEIVDEARAFRHLLGFDT